jgi:hypothetical protein
LSKKIEMIILPIIFSLTVSSPFQMKCRGSVSGGEGVVTIGEGGNAKQHKEKGGARRRSCWVPV